MLREKFDWPERDITFTEGQIRKFARHVESKDKLNIVTDDPSDNRILECGVASESEYLVTGDKHLLKVGQFAGMKIVTPADFLEVMAQQG